MRRFLGVVVAATMLSGCGAVAYRDQNPLMGAAAGAGAGAIAGSLIWGRLRQLGLALPWVGPLVE